jgi:hypothetical protein
MLIAFPINEGHNSREAKRPWHKAEKPRIVIRKEVHNASDEETSTPFRDGISD